MFNHLNVFSNSVFLFSINLKVDQLKSAAFDVNLLVFYSDFSDLF